LRAIAVSLVLAGHAGVPYLRMGGAVGVTIFFALSGYLITLLLLAEREITGGIALRAFYARRALRLLPAFVLMASVVGVWSIWWRNVPPSTYLADALPALLYVANLARIAGVDLGVMGHTWSLAVEEQFYLLWPALLLMVLASRAARWLPQLLAMIIAASLAVRYATLEDYTRSHDALDVNMYALAIGALVAVYARRGSLPKVPAWPGAAGIALALAPQASEQDFGVMSVAVSPLAALATGLILINLSTQGGMRALRWRGSRWIGELSYGIYLWHFPMLLLWPDQSPSGRVQAVLAALMAAYLSHRLVERPALRLKGRYQQM
jgi:peptidoglycan/LPS O-acetylase OafA/YrhL